MRSLVDNRMRGNLNQMWPSRVTIEAVQYTTSASNQQVPSGSTPVAGLTNIECRMGPLIEIRPTDDESRESQVLASNEHRQCKLNGYFPQITNFMVAVVDGVTFEIRGNESDSQKFSTRLKLAIIKP